MPIDYKLKTLRRLFGAHSFFRIPKQNVEGMSAVGAADGLRDIIDRSGSGADGEQEDRKEQKKSSSRPQKTGGGTPRAFFSESAPRSIRNKAVSGQLNIVHLFEKQKMRVYYGAMRDSKFKKYVEEAKRKRFNTDAALIRLLELRLDTLLYRTSFAKTPCQVRQWIAHGRIRVNGERLDIRSAQLFPGDVISIQEKYADHAIETAQEIATLRKQLGIGASWIVTSAAPEGFVPWLEIDRVGLSAALVRLPTDDEARAMQNATLFPYIRDAKLNPHAAMRAYR